MERGGFRSATPNSKGQYSDAVLNELESQNDEQVEGIMGKVRILKDVRLFFFSFFSPPSVPYHLRLAADSLLSPSHQLTNPPTTDDSSNRRRNPRLLRPCRKDERIVRPDPPQTPRHHEPDAHHGAKDQRRVEGVACLLRCCGAPLFLREVSLNISTLLKVFLT